MIKNCVFAKKKYVTKTHSQKTFPGVSDRIVLKGLRDMVRLLFCTLFGLCSNKSWIKDLCAVLALTFNLDKKIKFSTSKFIYTGAVTNRGRGNPVVSMYINIDVKNNKVIILLLHI